MLNYQRVKDYPRQIGFESLPFSFSTFHTHNITELYTNATLHCFDEIHMQTAKTKFELSLRVLSNVEYH
jgi:hypothetical protein